MDPIVDQVGMAQEAITFVSDKQWTTEDLSQFANAVELMYGVFFGLSTIVDLHLRGPEPGDMPWKERDFFISLMQGWSPTPIFDLSDLSSSSIGLWGRIEEGVEPHEFLKQLRGHSYGLRENSQLAVRRISMASPGIISFEGLGELVRELREFIKDIWYRNLQERKLGEFQLRVIQQYLARKEPLKAVRDPDRFDRAVVFLGIGVHTLAELEESDKLRDIVESLQHRDDE